MAAGERYAAFDLGAESGRAMLGTLDDTRLQLTEVARFPNGPVRVLDSLHWDVLRLWQEIKEGLTCIAANHGPDLAGIGLCTWGTDFALLDGRGALLGMPHHYRDNRTTGMLDLLRQQITEEELFRASGTIYLAMSSLCQLLSLRSVGSPALDAARRFLMIGDMFNFWLCGRQANESTLAGVTQFHGVVTRDWHRAFLDRLGLPVGMLGELVPAGTILGSLLPSVGKEVGLGPVPVIAPACHDTLDAASAVPSADTTFTFVSAGTWSVLGTLLDRPMLSDEALRLRFMNWIAPCGQVLFTRDSLGLWPLQECRREWQRLGNDWSYADLTEMAARARPFAAVLDPDHPTFARPGDMTAKIADFCRQTGQKAPTDPGSTVRSLLEGVALCYRSIIDQLDQLTGRHTALVHIVGGGCKNRLLCQFTADATRRPVLAGPAEATTAGVVLLQALARGTISSLTDVRAIIRRSFDLVPYEPDTSAIWDEAHETYQQLVLARSIQLVS